MGRNISLKDSLLAAFIRINILCIHPEGLAEPLRDFVLKYFGPTFQKCILNKPFPKYLMFLFFHPTSKELYK